MKLSCFVMMQSESPILRPFLDQIDAFFNQCIILDHQSTDNSISLVQERDPSRYRIYHLKTSGYPQSEVATWFAHALLSGGDSDFLFFLDCDEFLPFATRSELETHLLKNAEADVLTLHWLNVYPESFDGEDIFSKHFYHGAPSSHFKKVILNKSIVQKSANFLISQGYHSILAPDAPCLEIADIRDRYLIHIPVQSLVKLSFKAANRNNRILHDDSKKKLRLGAHWIDMGQQLAINGFDQAYLENLVLHYSEPDTGSPVRRKKLTFAFPYVKSSYEETPAYISSQIAGLVRYDMQLNQSTVPNSFSVADSFGNIVFTDKTMPAEYLLHTEIKSEEKSAPLAELLENSPGLPELIETLFDLPIMTPGVPNAGYLHFLLVLLKILKPRSYVLQSNGSSASLATVNAAVAEYNLETKVYCINTSQQKQSDMDAGGAAFEPRPTERLNVPLSEALGHFKNGSVDILHFEDLCEYQGASGDVSKWFNAMSPQGIIVFQSIGASSAAQSYWEELKKSFLTLEFSRLSWLGVVFLDAEDPRIAPVLALARDPKTFTIYSEFVYSMAKAYEKYENKIASKQTDIKKLNEIVQKYQNEIVLRISDIKELKSGMDALQSTFSWKITAPLRASKDLVRRFRFSQPNTDLKKHPTGPDCELLAPGEADPEAIFINIDGGNTGDLLISNGCMAFLRSMGIRFALPDSRLVDAALQGDHATLRRFLEHYRGTIFFSGGGNIGIYKENETVRMNIIRHAVNAKGILVFPQSSFKPENALKAANVTVWAREQQSHDQLKKAGIRTELVPDAAFYMEDSIPQKPDGTGCFFIRRAQGRCQERLDHPLRIGCSSEDLTYDLPVSEITDKLLPYGTIISDRLHGAIISIMMRKRTALLPVSYHKTKSFYDTWLKGDPGIAYIENQADLDRFMEGSGIPAVNPKELFLKHAVPAFDRFLNR